MTGTVLFSLERVSSDLVTSITVYTRQMRQRISSCTSLAASAVVCLGLVSCDVPAVASTQDASAQAKAAPDFSLKGSDGKTHTLASLSSDKPLVIVFIKDGCGATPRSMPTHNVLGKAYGKDEKVSYVGLINDDAERFERWAKVFKPEMTMLLDPGKEAIRAFGVRRSNETLVIEKGQIVKHYKALSRASVEEIAKILGQASPKDQSLDLSGAPEDDLFG